LHKRNTAADQQDIQYSEKERPFKASEEAVEGIQHCKKQHENSGGQA